ncbi:MAG: lipopolysaccharide assembly protein LapA domain-containing protein [Rhodospirillales bacterium]
MRLLTWLIVLPLGAVMAALGVANRGDVTLNLDPVPLTVQVPLFLLVAAAILVGFLWGAFVVWLGGGRHRRAARIRQHSVEIAERELRGAKERLARADKRIVDLESQLAERPDAPAVGSPSLGTKALPKPDRAA